jgi:hypothetical protein
LAHRSTCLEWPLEETTLLFSLLNTYVANATNGRDWPLFNVVFYIFVGYLGVEIVFVIGQKVVVTTLGVSARIAISQCALGCDRGVQYT